MASRAPSATTALGLLLLALIAGGAPAQANPPSCGSLSELDCLHSDQCTLVPAQQRGKYTCREAVGRCEIGFVQESDGDIKQACEAKPGCEFQPGSCFCPPDKVCVCGGGPPAQCVESGKPPQR